MDIYVKNAKKYRKLKKCSQKEIADLLHITQSAYCKKENGVVGFKIEEIIFLSHLYDIKIDDLIGEDEKNGES